MLEDLHHEQEQAKAARLQADKDGLCTDELERSLKACEDKLSALDEHNQKLCQANSQVSKKLDEIHSLEREGFAKAAVASQEASKRVKQLSLATPPAALDKSY